MHNFLFELFDIFGRHHTHKFHGVLLNEFNNFIHATKNWVFIPFFECENLSFPNGRDVIKLGFDLSFFGSSLNKFNNFLIESMKLKFDEIIKTELWRTELNVLLGESHQLFPMSLHHEFGVEFSDQRKNSVHILDSFS